MSLNFTNHSPGSRLIMATLAAFALGVAVPHTAFAASDVGIWKVDPSKSKYNANSATLSLHRVESGASGTGSFIVISGTGVYRMRNASAAAESAGLKPVDFQNMTRTGEAVLIGTRPRSNDPCGFACQHGLSEDVKTVTFSIVNQGDQQIRDMLAYEQPL